MTNFVFANNVSTTLGAPLTSSATSISVTSAANMPSSIPSGSYFVVTLNDVATGFVYEILWATAISGTTLTVLRGQEGTTATTWNQGDYVYAAPTAGQMAGLSGRVLNKQIFTSAGTYTPFSSAISSILVEAVGGGGGAGGCASTNTSQCSVAGGGQGGAYGKAVFTSGFTGGIPVTIGAGGAPGSSGFNAGGNGGTTSLGSLISAPGGSGGFGGSAQSTAGTFLTGAKTNSTPCTITGASVTLVNTAGAPAGLGFAAAQIQGGQGGSTPFGAQLAGGYNYGAGQTNVAIAGAYPGCGATGGSLNAAASGTVGAIAGAAGAAGIIIITEYS